MLTAQDRIEEQFTFGPITERTIKTRNGVELEADFIIVATGSRVRSDLVKGHESIASPHGSFKCDPTFQLASMQRVFALGDTVDLGLVRTAATVTFQLPILVANVVKTVQGKGQSLAEYKSGAEAISISVGPAGGASTIFGFFLPSWITRCA